jgi:hypothetical protein
VQSELLLHLSQHVLFGLIEAEPDELVVAGQRRPNLVYAEVGHSRTATVGGAVDHRRGRRRWRRDERVGHQSSLRQLRRLVVNRGAVFRRSSRRVSGPAAKL